MGHELAYVTDAQGGNKHISPTQKWEVKVANGVPVQMMLGGHRQNGERNTFAMKHLMAPSKKANQSQAAKAEKRLAHRADPGGSKAGNPNQGGKAASPYAQLRKDKYGEAAKLKNNAANSIANTVVDLSLINLNTFLYKLALACEGAEWQMKKEGSVNVDLGVACVRRVQLDWAGGANDAFVFSHDALAKTVDVTGMKVGQHAYEVYHLGKHGGGGD